MEGSVLKETNFCNLTQSSQFNKPEQQEPDQQTRLLHPAHTGLLHQHHLSMQSGTEYLFRDHRFTSLQCIKYPAQGKGVAVRSIRDCNGWNNFAASPYSNTLRADKWNFCRFPLVPRSVLLLSWTRKPDLLFRCIFLIFILFFHNFQLYLVTCN